MSTTKTVSLAEALPAEIERNKKLIEVYKSIGNVGVFARTAIQIDIEAAELAIANGDTVSMVQIYQKLIENE